MVTPERLREVKQQLDQLVERGWLVTWRWYEQDWYDVTPLGRRGLGMPPIIQHMQ
jgi:hypothetical protein